MVVRYDPEPVLQSVVEAAKNGFQGQLILEKIPVGVSESKGEVEKSNTNRRRPVQDTP